MGSPSGVLMNGMKLIPGITNNVSDWDRSVAQKKLAPRNSIAVRNIMNKPKNTGNCTSIGRQPATGLILFSRKYSICFCENFVGSSLCFSLSAASWGAWAAIFWADRVLAAVSGQNTILSSTVSTMIAQPYGIESAVWSQFMINSNPFEKNPKKPKPIALSASLLYWVAMLASVRYSFGPMNITICCSLVWPGAMMVAG